MAGKAELGKAFVDELLGKLPADRQAAVREVLSSPEASAALEFAGSRVSPLDEERTRLHEQATQLATREQKLNTWHGQLTAWKDERETHYTDRETKLAAREANPANPNPNPNPPPADRGNVQMTKAEIEKTVTDILAPREAAYVQYVADATRFAAFHLQNFKEPLDVTALVKHPQIGELGVQGVYELVHADKIAKMKTDAATADREALKNELRRELQTEQPVDMPYPLGEGSPLDVLTMDADKRPKGDPVTAARMYESLVGANAGR